MPTPQTAHGPLRSFGRIKSRPIKPRQEALMTSLLPALALPTTPFDPAVLAPGFKDVWLEIGFGGGEHLAGQATNNPDAVIFGAEPFVNGVASALRHVEEGELKNVRLHHGDAREIMAAVPEASLGRVFIMFPDPWQKARHHKRRLIQPEFITELARVMKPGAHLRFATDWSDYADWTLERFLAAPDLFRWLGEKADDWRIPPADHLTTRYETKKLGDCAPVFLEFQRL